MPEGYVRTEVITRKSRRWRRSCGSPSAPTTARRSRTVTEQMKLAVDPAHLPLEIQAGRAATALQASIPNCNQDFQITKDSWTWWFDIHGRAELQDQLPEGFTGQHTSGEGGPLCIWQSAKGLELGRGHAAASTDTLTPRPVTWAINSGMAVWGTTVPSLYLVSTYRTNPAVDWKQITRSDQQFLKDSLDSEIRAYVGKRGNWVWLNHCEHTLW